MAALLRNFSPNSVAVGIVGAATTPLDKPETRVGSFAMVCAPRSCTSWSDNWPHLNVRDQFTGHTFDGEPLVDDVLSLIGTYHSRFYRWLFDNFEQRIVDDENMVRPPSYKLCPPNHLLAGIDVLWDRETDEVMGVTHVICQPVNRDAPSPTTETSYGTRSEFELGADDSIGTFPWDRGITSSGGTGERFSISPRIGVADPSFPGSAVVTERLECDPERVVVGFKWARDLEGHLEGLALECADAPQPTADDACQPGDGA